MSVGRFLQQAAAGNAGEAVYVDDVFSTYLYDGTGSAQTITNGIDLAGEGGLVWIKGRTQNIATQDHRLVDTARGVNQAVSSSTNDNVFNITGEFTSFNSDGFTLAATSGNGLNRSGEEYCSWTFRNQPGFFQVLTYEGNGTAGRTVSHSLGSVPGCIIVKAAESGVGFNGDFAVYHRGNTAAPETERLILNSTAATADSSIFWNDTAPTATEFTLGASNNVNGSGVTYVAYLFAHDAQDFGTNSNESIIKCGSYTGNGSTNGPEINLGFEAQWVLIKNSGGAAGWIMADMMRGMAVDGSDPYLRPNASDAEYTTYNWIHPTATGFKLTETGGSLNSNGQTYIYVAIRRPHKPASEFAATDLFLTVAGTGNPPPNYISGFPVDMYFNRKPAAVDNWDWSSRLTQGRILQSNLTNAESTNSDFSFDYQNGVMSGGYGSTLQSWMFRRAPGFFDVVAYTGTGSATTINHNLNATPELLIVKCRSQAESWVVYDKISGGTKYMVLNSTSTPSSYSGMWNDTNPTDSVFTVGNHNTTNGSAKTYIAYLFATVSGISKIGSYTGTATDQTIDCGFSSGARFVLIKRTDASGAWYLWDSERGITSSDDPYLLLNSPAAQATASTKDIDPDSSGFVLGGLHPDINGSGGTYIFLAIA